MKCLVVPAFFKVVQAQILQKYEHLQQQTLNTRRIYRERQETDALDEWAVQSYARSDLARDLH